MADSTIKVGLDSSDVDALIEKLERATGLAAKLADVWPFLEHRVQATDYSEAVAAAQRDSDRKFFAEAAAPDGVLMGGESVGSEDGLTDAEREVGDCLVAAVNAFGALDRRHPDELRAFVDGIHACQHQLICRIVQRAYPKAWPIKRPE